MSSLRHIAAFCMLAALGGCGTAQLFIENDLPESAEIANTPYPRLVDTPDTPAPGSYGQGVPDPAQGEAVVTALEAERAETERRREAIAGPVIAPGLRARLLRHR